MGKLNAAIAGYRTQEERDDAKTSGCKPNAEALIRLLNAALATEIICILRYKRHYFMTAGVSARHVKAKFLQHVSEERAHADLLAERIVQLGGKPVLSTERLLSRNHAEQVEGDSLVEMLTTDLLAERIAIEHYHEMIASIGPDDPTTRQVLEMILADRRAHAVSLAHLVRDCTPE